MDEMLILTLGPSDTIYIEHDGEVVEITRTMHQRLAFHAPDSFRIERRPTDDGLPSATFQSPEAT